MKRLLLLIATIIAANCLMAQTPLPNDPEVRVGKLENGLTYYIRHNDKPAQRAEFYLATNVGAFQETDEQDGLAHFLEHMCFNGTKNFPGDNLLEYLRSIGAEFGRNINASTGFEQTQYMLNNIPIVRDGIIDSCLLILHDYSHYVDCLPEEIDAERGVILEERRTRRNAMWRMFEQSLPYMYGDTPYAKRTLIGGEEQLKTFEYHHLTDFYRKWYNPDMQAVIVVGDVDVDAIEAKIKNIFGSIPAPAVPTEKVLHKIPDNAEPIVAILTDPEASNSSMELMWKMDALPKQMRNTDQALVIESIKEIFAGVMYERFGDITSKANAPFLSANLGFQSLTETCEPLYGSISFKDGDYKSALAAFLYEVEKVKRYGFSDAEVERAKANIISRLEKQVEAASTRQNSNFIWPLLNNFYKNEPYMTPETELEIKKAVLGQFNSAIINQVVSQMIPQENLVVIYQGPERENLTNPTEAEILAILEAAKTAEVEANATEEVNEPLIDESKLKGSKVKKTETGIYGSTVWTLKNGLKVTVLPTDYKKDQILISLDMKGGKNLVDNADVDAVNSEIFATYLQNSGVSKFSETTLKKLLTGKLVSVYPFIGNHTHGISASSTPKDLETALQLMYLYFAQPRFDETDFQVGIDQLKAILPNILTQPQFVFQKEMNEVFYDNDPRAKFINMDMLENADIKTIEKVYRKLFSTVDGAEITIVGKVDLETLKPLVEKYLGSLPKGKKVKKIEDKSPKYIKGKVVHNFNVPMTTPKATLRHLYTAYMPVSMKTEVELEIANYVLSMIYTEQLREKEGGTYSPGVLLYTSRKPENMIHVIVHVDTNAEQAQGLSDMAVAGLKKLAEEGPTEDQMNKSLENLKKNVPENRISNNYWSSNIQFHNEWGVDKDAEYEAALANVTAEDVKKTLQDILAQGNFIEFIMYPETTETPETTEE